MQPLSRHTPCHRRPPKGRHRPQPSPELPPREWTSGLTALLITVLLSGFASPALAGGLCIEPPGLLAGFDPGPDLPDPAINCQGFLRCYQPELSGPFYTLVPTGCDPEVGTCSVRATTPVVFPGNDANPFPPPGSRGWVTLDWTDSSGGFAGSCGVPGGNILWDQGDAWIQISQFTCTGSPHSDVYTLLARACQTGCPKQITLDIDLSLPLLQQLFCDPPPPKDSCDEECGCPVPERGVGFGGGGPRGVAPAQGGPVAPPRYSAGGAGHPGAPGSGPAGSTSLGRYWSHDFAQRILEDPNETHVWLITGAAVFREFSDLVKGVYQSTSPSDEVRTLHWLGSGNGWELRSPDGTIEIFADDGHWERTADRNGNQTEGIYGGGELTAVILPDSRTLDFSYHPDGKLASITETGGGGSPARTWLYTWTGEDLTRIDRPDGTAWALLYDDPRFPGYLTRMTLIGTDGSQRIESAWEYDADGNVVRTWKGASSFGDPGAVGKFELSYDDPLLPAQTTVDDFSGQVTTYTFDRDPASFKARLLAVSGGCPVCGFGPETQFVYGDPGHPLRPTRTVDGRGFETLFSYGPEGQITSKTEAFGTGLERTTTWEYNDPAFPVFPTAIIRESVTGSPAERRTDLVYDVEGNTVQRTESGIEDGSAFVSTTAFTYNGAGRVLTIDPPGFGTTDVTSFTYDPARGDLVPSGRTDPLVGATLFDHDGLNRRLQVTDPNDVATQTAYDDLDRVLSVTEGIQAAAGWGQGRGPTLMTSYAYNPFGDLLRTTLPRGNVIEYGYDPAGRLISIERKPDAGTPGERLFYTLDLHGNRALEEQQRWDGGGWVTEADTAFVYSSRCRVQQIVEAPGSPEESVTEHAYDCNGNLEEVWDANHPSGGANPPSEVRAYDALDRLVSVARPWPGGGDAVTAFGYDVQDHLSTVTDAEGNVTTYAVSDRDLLTEETSPVSGLTRHAYNEHGVRTSTTDARNITVTHTVDAADRVTLVAYPDPALNVAYAYGNDPLQFNLGRLIGITRGGETVAYAYDRFGRRTQDGELAYTYDDNGNRIRVDYLPPLGVAANYSYDFADRPASLSIETPSQAPTDLITAASYLPGGPLASLTLGTGDTVTRSYDRRYLPVRIQVPGRLDWQYASDGLGNVTAVTDALDPAGSRSFAYTDALYFLEQGDGPWGTRAWTYDRIGNRLTEVRDGGPADLYSYPSNGSGHLPQLDLVTLGGGGSIDYTYGAAGHLTERFHNVPGQTSATSFSYDDEGRLAQVAVDGETTSVLDYDGRSYLQRSEWQVYLREPGGGEFPYSEPTYDSGGTLFHMRTIGGPGPGCNAGDRFYFYFAGRPAASWFDSVCEYPSLPEHYVSDHLGTPILIFDTAGNELWQGGFEPFGEDGSGSVTPLRLPGQVDDLTWNGAGARLYYNVHRWYEYGTGRYTRPDPLGQMGDIHLYRYVAQSPVNKIDPLGLQLEVPPEVPFFDPYAGPPPECSAGPWVFDGYEIGRGEPVYRWALRRAQRKWVSIHRSFGIPYPVPSDKCDCYYLPQGVFTPYRRFSTWKRDLTCNGCYAGEQSRSRQETQPEDFWEQKVPVLAAPGLIRTITAPGCICPPILDEPAAP